MSTLEPGNVVLGRYRIARSLGAGGMGVVYLAQRTSDGSKVVIKTVKEHLARDPEMRARFLREAEATRALRHPHIVDVIETSADPLLLVLEHLPGRSLQEHLRQGPLPEAEVISIARQLLDALDVAHRAKLIHRDIKPANVMVLQGARVKLLDFGLSRMVDEARHTKLTQTGQILGTPGYLAPEQALARPVDARTDLYSLGVLMYRALAGRLPFEGRAASLLRAVVEDEPYPLPELRPNVDPGLASVVHRALQKDPAYRFQTARQMREALIGPKKSRWMMIAAGVGVATAALTVGVLALVQPEPEPELLALQPVQPIVFDAHVASEEAEAEAEAVAEPEAEAETEAEAEPEPELEAAPTRMARHRAREQAEPEPPLRRPSRFEVEFPLLNRAPLQHWWRLNQTMVLPCFNGMPEHSYEWSVSFDSRAHVSAISAGAVPYHVTRCVLNGVGHAPAPLVLRDTTQVRFRVRWIPG